MLTGYSGYSNNPKSKISGSMPNRGAVSQKLSINGSYTIPVGYHNGSGKVTQSVPTQGGKTVTPTGSTQTVVSAGRYVTGDIKVAGVSGLPDVQPNLTVKINEDNVGSWYATSANVIGTNIISSNTELKNYLSYTKLMFRVKLRFKNASLKDLGYMYVQLGNTGGYYNNASLKFLMIKISDGTILSSTSGLTAKEFSNAIFSIYYYKASTGNIISAKVQAVTDNITGNMPYYMEITLVGAWK